MQSRFVDVCLKLFFRCLMFCSQDDSTGIGICCNKIYTCHVPKKVLFSKCFLDLSCIVLCAFYISRGTSKAILLPKSDNVLIWMKEPLKEIMPALVVLLQCETLTLESILIYWQQTVFDFPEKSMQCSFLDMYKERFADNTKVTGGGSRGGGAEGAYAPPKKICKTWVVMGRFRWF